MDTSTKNNFENLHKEIIFNETLYIKIFDYIKSDNWDLVLKIIEENLLRKFEINNKIPQFKIYEQLQNGNIKIFTDIGNKSIASFILKISGIWETQYNYGLTYKFISNATI